MHIFINKLNNMNEEQIAELKALVDDLESQGLSTADIQSRVDQRKAEFAETVEVTDEIQTTPTEGKTNGAVVKGATATPVTGQAPESTESDSENGSLELLGNYRDAITLTPEEQAVIDNPIDFMPKGVVSELQPYNPETNENLVKTIFDDKFRDPTTGQVFEDAKLVYRADVDETGVGLPTFQPYQKELDSARKQLIENGISEPDEKQVQELAEKQIKKLFKYNKIKEKSRNFLEGISEKEREELIPYAVDDFITLENKFKSLNEQYASIFNKYKKSPNAFNLKNINFNLLFPYLIGSIPFAFIGGSIKIEKSLFEILLFCVLLVAGIFLLIESKSFNKEQIKINQISRLLSISIGSIIGFMSGIVGIGGGIFLSPLLFLMKAGYPRHITSSASLFILINSIFGLAGQLTKDQVLNQVVNYWPLFLAVLIGGQIGSLLNIKFLSNKILALLTSFLVIFVAIRMGIKLVA